MKLHEFKDLTEEEQYEYYLKIKAEQNKHKDLMRVRCLEDVRINTILWERLLEKAAELYAGHEENFIRLIKLLNFIMVCAHKQEMQGLYVDVEKTNEHLHHFEGIKDEKIKNLTAAMPKVPVKSLKRKPKKLTKADGTFSALGEKWVALCKQVGVDFTYDGEIEVITAYIDGNPNSVTQKKKWLYDLGWVPQTYKYVRNKETGETKKVEQIMTEDKMLCPSVLKLAEKEPAIHELDSLTVLTHRIGILKGFLENMDENNMLVQGLGSLAVTMRWMHKNIVNLPRYTGKGDLRDGNWIRSCLVPPKGYKIVQSDLSGIESRTSDHYTFHINPDRIVKTQKPFFDPHTEISVTSNLMSPAEEVFYIFKGAVKDNPDLDIHTFSDIYKWSEDVQMLLGLPEDSQKALLSKIKNARSKGKTTNYASLYLVGAKTLARNLEITEKEAQELIDSYWKIHFAVLEATKTFKTKRVGSELWVLNPISNFMYNVRDERQVFSVVNQSSAVYCFNMWVYFISKRGYWAVTQTHDDLALLEEDVDNKVEECRVAIHAAMDDLNKYLKLNVKLDCESQIGDNLAETH